MKFINFDIFKEKMIKIPNYTITKKIASGGMGDVYLTKTYYPRQDGSN